MPQRILQRAAGAALLSGLLLVLRGRRDAGDGAAALNAISHWVWPRSAFSARGFSARHTATGALIHCGASCFWSVLFASRQAPSAGPAAPTRAPAVLAQSLALSALAAWVDLAVVPPALSPGFERRLSRGSLCLVYLGFAAGLALGELWPGTGRAAPRPSLASKRQAARRPADPPAVAEPAVRRAA